MDWLLHGLAVLVFSWVFMSHSVTDKKIRTDPFYSEGWDLKAQRTHNKIVLLGLIGFGIWLMCAGLPLMNGVMSLRPILFFVAFGGIFIGIAALAARILNNERLFELCLNKQHQLDRVSFFPILIVIIGSFSILIHS
ncbi:MAG: hypothetical protein ACXW30_01745 [Micavibrio sp.]